MENGQERHTIDIVDTPKRLVNVVKMLEFADSNRKYVLAVVDISRGVNHCQIVMVEEHTKPQSLMN